MESSIVPSESKLSPTARILWILLIAATLYISYYRNLGVVGLVGPDEPRYAWIAREMVESHDWVTPRLYGQPWFEKPVLYYWSAALCFKWFGVSETTARLPGAFFALMATLALAWVARRLYGWETARWLLLLLPTTVGMIGFSHAAATDMPFAATLTVAMVFAATILGLGREKDSDDSRKTPWLELVFFGSFLGLAVLAKGPAALILSGGPVLIWAAITKRWRDAFRCLHPLAIASFCLTALPWYMLCARRNPDFLRVFIIEHNFKRFLTPEFQHVQPFWFYIPVVLIAFIPWTLALLWSAVIGPLQLRKAGRYPASAIFFIAWALFCVAFFSVSKSKLPGYVLPAIPAIGLLLAQSIVASIPRHEKSFQWLLIGGALLAAMLSVVAWKIHPGGLARINSHALLAGCWILLLLAFGNFLLALGKTEGRISFDLSPLCVVPILVLLLLLPRVVRSFVPADPSGKVLARELMANKIPMDQLQVAAMPRGQQFSLNFYLHREIPAWDPQSPRVGMLLKHSNRCDENLQLPWICINEPVPLSLSGWYVFPIDRLESTQGLGDLGGRDARGALRSGKPR